MAALECNC